MTQMSQFLPATSWTNIKRRFQSRQERSDRHLVGIYLLTIACVIAGMSVLISDIGMLAGTGPGMLSGSDSIIDWLGIIGPVLLIVLTPAALFAVAYGTLRGRSWARYFAMAGATSSILIASTGNFPFWVIPVALVAIVYLNLPDVRLHFSAPVDHPQSKTISE